MHPILSLCLCSALILTASAACPATLVLGPVPVDNRLSSGEAILAKSPDEPVDVITTSMVDCKGCSDVFVNIPYRYLGLPVRAKERLMTTTLTSFVCATSTVLPFCPQVTRTTTSQRDVNETIKTTWTETTTSISTVDCNGCVEIVALEAIAWDKQNVKETPSLFTTVVATTPTTATAYVCAVSTAAGGYISWGDYFIQR